MALTATCPKCATSSAVPDEALGRKVRCKRCQNIFIVEAAPASAETSFAPEATPGPDASKPTTPARPASRPEGARPVSSAGGPKGPPAKSQRTLWIVLGVL